MARSATSRGRRPTITQQIRQVQDLWDRIAAHPERIPLTEAQGAELDRRLAAEAARPAGDSWAVVKRRLRKRR